MPLKTRNGSERFMLPSQRRVIADASFPNIRYGAIAEAFDDGSVRIEINHGVSLFSWTLRGDELDAMKRVIDDAAARRDQNA